MTFDPGSMLGTVFGTFGQAATYQPPAGAQVPCRAIPQGLARQVDIGGVRLMLGQSAWHLRRAEFGAAPAPGGTLTIGSRTWTIDIVEPAADDPLELKWQVRAEWGTPIVLRATDGQGATANPPIVDGLVVDGAVAGAATSIALRAGFASGQLRAGDVLRVGGADLVVAAPVSAAGNGFAAVPLASAAPAPIVDGVAVEPRFARDFRVIGAEVEYAAHEIVGGVQAGDRRLIVLRAALEAAGYFEAPSTKVQVEHLGTWLTVVSATAIGTGAEHVAWDLQLR